MKCDAFDFCCSRPHPYSRQRKMNAVRSLNNKSHAGMSANDRLMIADDIENKVMDSKVKSGRKKDSPLYHKDRVTNVDRSSKWSKFLSSDVMNDDSHAVSDNEDSFSTSSCSTANLQPFMVSMSFL